MRKPSRDSRDSSRKSSGNLLEDFLVHFLARKLSRQNLDPDSSVSGARKSGVMALPGVFWRWLGLQPALGSPQDFGGNVQKVF